MTPLDRMREICRSLPNLTEAPHFGDTMFKSRGRPFASCGDKEGVMRVVVQLEPAHIEPLLASDPFASRYPRAKDCVAIEITGATDWDQVGQLVLESHRLTTKEKPTKKTPGKKAPVKKRPR